MTQIWSFFYPEVQLQHKEGEDFNKSNEIYPEVQLQHKEGEDFNKSNEIYPEVDF